ncbi:hypothetical protein [Lentibacillus saliphilus]|uniref:hypothetical protein n=1 Tax=Lentibacillus saliphilus TaxID=2737028 RepID=UPI001C304496|nr:hypothetical protein [Lentibacillus saliphilus]
MEFVKGLILYGVSLFIIYFVIETAVKNGINHSRIGRLLEQEHKRDTDYPNKTSRFDAFVKNDLDN